MPDGHGRCGLRGRGAARVERATQAVPALAIGAALGSVAMGRFGATE
jgi:hypothetical protein